LWNLSPKFFLHLVFASELQYLIPVGYRQPLPSDASHKPECYLPSRRALVAFEQYMRNVRDVAQACLFAHI